MSEMTRQVSLASEETKKRYTLWNWFEIVLIAILFALILRAYVFQAYRIPSTSMEDTLLVGDFLLGEKITFRVRPPEPGELVIFKYPLNPDKSFIKRCIAIEEDTVVIRDKVLYVNGIPYPDPEDTKYFDPRILPAIYSNRDNFGPNVVPKGHIFVLGDNRDNSQDSRYWGFLPLTDLEARPLITYFSWAPDPSAPEIYSPLSYIMLFFHNLFHFPSRTRWERIGRSVW